MTDEHSLQKLSREEISALLPTVPQWALTKDAQSIHRAFIRQNFHDALSFINRVGEIAEREKHHPTIHWSHNSVLLALTTQHSNGLSHADFELARKLDTLR